MEFLIANQNLLISLGVLLVIIVIGLIGIPYLKKNNLVKQEDLENTRKAIEIANALIYVMKFDKKNQITSIFNIVEYVLDYMASSLDDEDRANIAYLSVIKILNELHVEVDEQLNEVINLAINTSLGKIEN